MNAEFARKLSRGKMSVSLCARGIEWTVYFLDITRSGKWWAIECAVDGPSITFVTVHAEDDRSLAGTAQRVLTALRQLVESGAEQERAVLELPATLSAVS